MGSYFPRYRDHRRILGFGGLAAGAAEIAKIIFYIFLVLLVLSLLFGSRIWKG